MPGVDPLSAAVAASEIGIGLANSVLQGKSNRKNRKFAEKMANQSRRWALEDWNAQNQYNSPASQMERYKAAGLNPHLIYGQSNESASVRSTDSAKFEQVAPQLDINPTGIMHSYNETRMADANYDNALKQAAVLEQEAVLKKAQITDTLASAQQKGVNTERAIFDLGIESELRPTSLEYRKGALRKQEADTAYTLDNNQRQEILQASNLRQAVATLAETQMRTSKMSVEKAEIREKIKNLHLDESLKSDELALRSAGLTPSSPTYQKIVAKHLERILGRPGKETPLKKWWDTKFEWGKEHPGGKAPKPRPWYR